MLLYTGIQRTSSDVTGTYAHNLLDHEDTMKCIQAQPAIINMRLRYGDLSDVGRMLGVAWLYKKLLSPNISTPHIDAIYNRAINAGALGGKLLGGGGGGFMLFYVTPEKQQNVRDALTGLIEVPFKFESEGSKVVYHE